MKCLFFFSSALYQRIFIVALVRISDLMMMNLLYDCFVSLLKGRDHLGDQGIGGRNILKLILKK
jgi:hypothetical protein